MEHDGTGIEEGGGGAGASSSAAAGSKTGGRPPADSFEELPEEVPRQPLDRHAVALGIGMRLYGVLLALATTTFAWLPAVSRWPPYHPPYERMFIALFFSWGLCLYRAARAPRHNLGLVDFTALQGLLHGGVMAVDVALGHAGHHGAWHLLGDVLFHLSAPVVLGLLRNRVEPYRLGLTRLEALAFLGVFGACLAVAIFGL